MTTRADFGDGFSWGVATSAYQIEGAAAEDGRGPSIWDTFSHTPGTTHDGDTGDVADDHYHRYREDVRLMEELGVDAYRFSISWSRILPEGTGRVNEDGVAFYRSLCQALVEAGIEPVVTLYHWDLPQALQDVGGWLDVRSATWFADYATVAKERLGDLVRIWTTHNEPWCAAYLGHGKGLFAPGLTDPGSAYVAAHNLMLAHHRAIAALRQTSPRPDDQLGIVLNLIPAWPAGDTDDDRQAAAAVDAIQNRQFADAVFFGTYPDEVLEAHARFGIDDVIDPVDLAGARQDIDFLGVNYYNIHHVAHVPGAPAPPEWPAADGAMITRPPGELTATGWGVEPEGLAWMLKRVDADYPPVPLLITENGAAYHDEVSADGSVHDTERARYLQLHLAAVADAISEGVDVRGYFAWSLLDNFEWAEGYSKRFGLVRVDYETQERTIKDSGHWYRKWLAGEEELSVD
ncbi:MAG: GH1 family beta-glucosidase [Acidimicrobiia bacterium]